MSQPDARSQTTCDCEHQPTCTGACRPIPDLLAEIADLTRALNAAGWEIVRLRRALGLNEFWTEQMVRRERIAA